MRGGCRTACDVEARRPKSIYLPPCRGYEAAVALPATLKPGGRSRPTCCLDLEITERPQWTYLPLRRRSEAAFVIPSASMPGCCSRRVCLLKDNWRRMSSNLPPRRGCEAAVAIPATWMLGDELITSAALPCMRGGCRFTCRLEYYWRTLSTYLPPRRGCEAAVGKLAVLTWSSLDAEVDLPAASP